MPSALSIDYNIRMGKSSTSKRSEFDIIEPIGKRVVVRKDDNKRETRSGIVLPDSHEIPVITGRVIAISKAIENDEDQTIRQYDKVLFDPRGDPGRAGTRQPAVRRVDRSRAGDLPGPLRDQPKAAQTRKSERGKT